MRFIRRLTISPRAVQVLATVLLVDLTMGCATADPPGSKSHTVHSCSPNYIDENQLGSLSVQQRGPSPSPIQWGAYPKLPAARYHVRIYIGSRVADTKNQNYAPHGSIGPYYTRNNKRVKSYTRGQIFKIVGTSYDPKGNVVQKFFIKCRLV
jgi:hypothetical protein